MPAAGPIAGRASGGELGGDRAEVDADHGARRQSSRLQGAGALAGEDQDAAAAGGMAGLQVPQRIPDDGGLLRIGTEAPEDVEDHSGAGLAAVAVGIRGMRAEEDRLDASSRLVDRLVQLGVYRRERVEVEQTAGDARLVRRDRDPVARPVELRDRGHRAGQRMPLVRVLDEGVAVLVDDAVAIEDEQLHVAASFEMSATRFISRCRRASSASRLLRTRSSSAMTMTSSKKRSTAARVPAMSFMALV